MLLSHLPEGDPLFPDDYLTDQPERTLAAEMVREQVLAHTRDELPFSTAVVVDQFEEPETTGRAAAAVLHDLRRAADSQKPIVIGRAGDMIKRIGTAARLELERFFETKVYPRSPRQSEAGLARGRAHAGQPRASSKGESRTHGRRKRGRGSPACWLQNDASSLERPCRCTPPKR